ncbi:MAG: hypothetical protein MK137_09615 [Rickettsiales bacterium]|nr:hypothetical protein [Rickettsiales bacterium]
MPDNENNRDIYGYGTEEQSSGAVQDSRQRTGRRRTILSFDRRVETLGTSVLDRRPDPLIHESKGMDFSGLPKKPEDIGEIGALDDLKADRAFLDRLNEYREKQKQGRF